MIEDRELENWREQWGGIAEPLPGVHDQIRQKIQRKIKHQDRQFMLENLLAGIAFMAGLIFAFVVVRQQNRMGTGWAAAIVALMFMTAGYRIWAQRGAWRVESQSTRAFLELWHKRVAAKIRLLRWASYEAPIWLIVCGVLVAVNWKVIGPDIKSHPWDWLAPLIASFFMLPIIFFFMAWYKRRKLKELSEVKRFLDELTD